MADKTVTVTSSEDGGNYRTLAAALAGESTNLVSTLDGILTIECYSISGGDTSAAVTGTGYTTDSAHYINIVVPAAERHAGLFDTTKYYKTGNYVSFLYISTNYTRVTGLQFYGYYDRGIFVINCTDILVDSCIWNGNGQGLFSMSIDSTTAFTSCEVRNSLFYNQYQSQSGIGTGSAVDTHILFRNCTIADHNVSWFGNFGGVASIVAINCGFHNIYAISDWPDTTQTTCSTTTPTWEDEANRDYRLTSADTTWQGQGTDLSADFTNDITGATRTTPFSIGAFQFVAAGTNYDGTSASGLMGSAGAKLFGV
jgi:hypothetical protein